MVLMLQLRCGSFNWAAGDVSCDIANGGAASDNVAGACVAVNIADLDPLPLLASRSV